ncbi:MAG: (d)CMP kinase [Desulfobacteraceae bacterium]|nr:(d)CMP kinase [Desulfobacteraceae bacterium]
MDKITITIDGPAGAGKSTISKLLAAQIDFVYVDTGALYRGVAYEVKKAKIDYKDNYKLIKLLKTINFDCKMEGNAFKLISKGIDISEKIRTSEISMLASAVSALSEVRSALLGIQQDIAVKYNAVFEGRDMGTVVFPDAEYKFFLIADLKIRAERRYKETIDSISNNSSNNISGNVSGNSEDLSKIEKDMKKRDHDDSTRTESPLKQADNAILIDSTSLTIEQVVEKIRTNLKFS